MTTKAFLASEHLSGLFHVLPDEPRNLRTIFIPTAGSIYEKAPWVDAQRTWFADNGFAAQELELAAATAGETKLALAEANLVYVAGGNTYYLLHHMNRTNFWGALSETDVVYSGSSAGAIVACPDIAYIEELDEPELVPQLMATTGAGLVNFSIMPHMDRDEFRPIIDGLLLGWPEEAPLVKLNDDEAIVVEHDGSWSVVASPEDNLITVTGGSLG